jgi:hypothetical protein
MISVKNHGLVMKLRGMMFGSLPELPRLRAFCFPYLPERFFLFAFDRAWGFL